MQDLDDLALLREYAANNSETAFEELVSRRVGFVYSSALRQVRDAHLAGEITQAVFIILAQKAGRISDKTVLTGWLFKTTRFAALAQMRADAKLQRQKKEFQMQSQIDDLSRRSEAKADEIWNQMSPLLDEALASLGETDRQALLLRFFENKSLAEVGNYLGAGEDTARKRVSRALEKLRKFFTKRGVSSTAAIIAGTISANSVQAAPVTLAKSVTAMAIAKGAAASGSTLTLIKGALKIMAWTKMKTAIVASVVVLLAAGTTTVTVREIQEYRKYSWEVQEVSIFDLFQAQPQVVIIPTKFPQNEHGSESIFSTMGAMGIAQPLKEIIRIAYQGYSFRTVIETDLQTNKYDFLAKLASPIELQLNSKALNLPTNTNWTIELQKEIAQKFGVKGHFEMRSADVLVLKAGNDGSRNFKIGHLVPPAGGIQAIQSGARIGYSFYAQPVAMLQSILENGLQIPVIDETGLTQDYYDFLISWMQSTKKLIDKNNFNLELPKVDELNAILLDQLGLELVPTNMPIEMLVVEKVK